LDYAEAKNVNIKTFLFHHTSTSSHASVFFRLTAILAGGILFPQDFKEELMKKPSQTKIPSQLKSSLEGTLKHYALAAGATGIGLLASSSSAEAKVIYTPANEAIPYNGAPVPIDLNHDGTDDFALSAIATYGARHSQAFIQVTPSTPVNRVWGLVEKAGFRSASILAAADLPLGVEVGPKGRFANGGAELLADRSLQEGTTTSTRNYLGGWANYGKGVTNRFLGFSFTINSETHYGWARLNVVWGLSPTATLTGYAYETVANKQILTEGVASSANTSTTETKPATLGHLAEGSAAIPAWRIGGAPEH
jgi:hypothetical protein